MNPTAHHLCNKTAQGKVDDLLLHGDAEAFLRALAIAIPARVDDRAPCWDEDDVAVARGWRAKQMRSVPAWRTICDALQAALPEDAMIYSDMTQFAYVAEKIWEMPKPNRCQRRLAGRSGVVLGL